MKGLFFSIIAFILLITGCKEDKYVAVTNVSLDETSLTRKVADGFTTLKAIIEPADATNKNVTWSSDKPNIVYVSDKGEVFALETGTANITVTTEDGEYKATCTVTVIPLDLILMFMTTVFSNNRIYLAGTGTVRIYWGNNGAGSETRTLTSYNEDDWNDSFKREKYEFRNDYYSTGLRTIAISLLLESSTNDDKITHVNCWGNHIVSLDVSSNKNLIYLDCEVNELISLDVSNNPKLTYLGCTWNLLTNLDVSKNQELTHFYCGLNELTSLDLSKNTALTSFNCYNNKLTSSELDALFETLHDNEGNKTISIRRNPGTDGCDRSIAINKGWTFND